MSGPVRVTALGKVATGSVLWRTHDKLHCTVVVKAVFSLRDGEAMQRTAASRVNADDTYNGDDPKRSVRLPSDLAPYLGRCDVVFVGNAYAPPGTKKTNVRLAVLRGDEPVLDKKLVVMGQRAGWQDEPKAFNRMPLDFEHAFGGAGIDSNPVGTGSAGGAPNVVDALVQDRPGSFGAIARIWPARRKLLSTAALDGLRQRVIELPVGFDWSFFQAAPDDQRVPHLAGDEWLILEGLIPGRASFKSRLPGAQAVARVWPVGAPPSEPGFAVALAADQLSVLGDARMCTVTWRGSFPIESEDVLAALMIAAGVEHTGEPIDWSAAFREEAPRAAVDASVDEANALVRQGTTQKRLDAALREAIIQGAPKLPGKVPAGVAAAAAQAQVVELGDAEVQSVTPVAMARIVIDDESTTVRVQRGGTPFAAAAGNAPPPPSGVPAQRIDTGTVALKVDPALLEAVKGGAPGLGGAQRLDTGTVSVKVDAKNAPWAKAGAGGGTPFVLAPPGKVLRPVDIPGAPWSSTPGAPTEPPKSGGTRPMAAPPNATRPLPVTPEKKR